MLVVMVAVEAIICTVDGGTPGITIAPDIVVQDFLHPPYWK